MAGRPEKRRRLSPSGGSEVSSRLEDDAKRDSDEPGPRGAHDHRRKSAAPWSHSEANRTTSTERNGRNRTRTHPQAGDAAAYSSGLYRSNVFKLQLDDLLSQSAVKPGKTKSAVETALRSLKSIIEKIPDREALPIAEAEKLLIKRDRVAIPFPDPRPPHDANYKLEYKRPTIINVVGSLPLNLISKSKADIVADLAVTMPDSLFQEKDYLDYRYFYRRAYYVACIAAGINKTKHHEYSLAYENLNGNRFHPILVVSPAQENRTEHSLPKWCIHIIPATSPDVFPAQRTLPDKSCVRSRTSSGDLAKESSIATPVYNASLRMDALVTPYLKLLHDTIKGCEGFHDACVLGRTWLRKRGLESHVTSGGFGGFEWAVIMAILLQAGRSGGGFLSFGYSSYQLFKGTLQFLASKDLIKSPYKTGGVDVEMTKGSKTPCFFDGIRGLNILFKMNDCSYQLLRYEANNSVSALGDGLFDRFDATFRDDVTDPSCRFDATIKIPISVLTSPPGVIDAGRLANFGQQLYDLVSKALTDRVSAIHVQVPKLPGWKLNSIPSYPVSGSVVQIGLIVNPSQASRVVDLGPSKDDKKAAKAFRQFWGEKAELRQFNDLRILESVKWDDKASAPCALEQIILHVLTRHMGQDVARAAEIAVDVLAPKAAGKGKALAVIAKDYQPILNAFTQLERDVRALQGLPLQIRRIIASDPLLRCASLENPTASASKLLIPPADVILQFEGSVRWPDDVAAIQHTKAALLLKLSDVFSSTHPVQRTRVGVENQANALLNQAFLDITYPSTGHTFRIRIHHDREAVLLERQLQLPTLRGLPKARTAHALAVHRRDFLRRPAHTQALQTLSTRFPALAPAIRLAKTWFAAHLLFDPRHVRHELVELLVVAVFTDPWPWAAPGSASTALARTLHFLASWDWKTRPLVVDFSARGAASSAAAGVAVADAEHARSGLTAADVAAAETRFRAWRSVDPALNRVVLFAASSADADGATWTDGAAPARVVAARATALARAASTLLRRDGLGVDADVLFAAAVGEFDFVVWLDGRVVGASAAKQKGGAAGFKNLEVRGVCDADVETVAFAPMREFVGELREMLGDAVVLFYDAAAPRAVCGLWNPGVGLRRRLKAKHGVSSVPAARSLDGEEDGGPDAVVVNRRAVLNDIVMLGGDLIRKVDVNKPLDLE